MTEKEEQQFRMLADINMLYHTFTLELLSRFNTFQRELDALNRKYIQMLDPGESPSIASIDPKVN